MRSFIVYLAEVDPALLQNCDDPGKQWPFLRITGSAFEAQACQYLRHSLLSSVSEPFREDPGEYFVFSPLL